MGVLIFFYTIWSNVLLLNHSRVKPEFMTFWETCTVLLACYFQILIVVEFYKTKTKFDFITKKEESSIFTTNNLTKWFMPVLIVSSILYANYLGMDDLSEGFWILNSWAALLVWWRMIFYLQSN